MSDPVTSHEAAAERARVYLNRRYDFPGESVSESYQTAVREGRDVARDVLALAAALSAAQERYDLMAAEARKVNRAWVKADRELSDAQDTLREIAYVPGGNEYDGIRSAARAALAPADTETPDEPIDWLADASGASSLMTHSFSGDPWGRCSRCEHPVYHPIHRTADTETP